MCMMTPLFISATSENQPHIHGKINLMNKFSFFFSLVLLKELNSSQWRKSNNQRLNNGFLLETLDNGF